MGEAWRLLRDTVGERYEDRAQRLGGALGLVILIPLTGVFLGLQAAQGHIVDQIEFLILVGLWREPPSGDASLRRHTRSAGSAEALSGRARRGTFLTEAATPAGLVRGVFMKTR